MVAIYGILPHEQLNERFHKAFDASPEYEEAEKKLQKAFEDFDLDASQDNASKILTALLNVEIEKHKIRYGIVHEKDEKPASSFMYQIRHT